MLFVAAACRYPDTATEPTGTIEAITPTPTATPTATPTPSPTPEPTPAATPERVAWVAPYVAPQPEAVAVAGCPAVIVEVFGAQSPAACAVSWCESRWNPNATGSQGERGYFQVHPRWHPDSTYDPLGNTWAAYRISQGGTNWSQWTCKP